MIDTWLFDPAQSSPDLLPITQLRPSPTPRQKRPFEMGKCIIIGKFNEDQVLEEYAQKIPSPSNRVDFFASAIESRH